MSTIRPLDGRVGEGRHRLEHVYFLRACRRCGASVEFCGSCEPGRLYCLDGCGDLAREESVRRAHVKFNDRSSEEGLEVHRVEERERRDRRAAEREQLEHGAQEIRVGDHRCHEGSTELQVPPSAVSTSAVEVVDVAAFAPLHSSRAACAALVEWVLVAGPGLLLEARRRLHSEATCPCCGQRGRVVRVVGVEQWRRRTRRGFG